MVRSRVPRKILAVIPARYASSRFPGKALARVDSRTMLEHVYERVSMARYLSTAIIATDDQRIYDEARRFGARVQMTRDDHVSGTDRVAEVASAFEDVELVVNMQGDEPLIDPAAIDAAILPLLDEPAIPMGTLKKKIEDPREIADPNVVKVVTDRFGDAIYFSRSPIPYLATRWRPPGSLQTHRSLRLPPGFSAADIRTCPWARSRRRSGWNNCARWKTASRSA